MLRPYAILAAADRSAMEGREGGYARILSYRRPRGCARLV
jgi:hypothetical protein